MSRLEMHLPAYATSVSGHGVGGICCQCLLRPSSGSSSRCTWEVTFDFFTMQRLGLKHGAATMHFLNYDGTLLTLEDDNEATYTVNA